MHTFLKTYRFFFLLSLALLLLLAAPLASQAQVGRVDKVLESKKQKRQKKGKSKAQRKAKKARGADGTNVYQGVPPLSKPTDNGRSGGRYKPKSNGMRRSATPVRRSGTNVDPSTSPRMQRTRRGRAGKLESNLSAQEKKASSPKMRRGSDVYHAPDPLMVRPKPGEKGGGKALPRKEAYHKPELGEGKKLMRSRQGYPAGNDEGLYSGSQKVKKGNIKEPGTHYSERSSKRQKFSGGEQFEGNFKAKVPDRRPGNPYKTPKVKDVVREGGRRGTLFSGNRKIHKSEVTQPGVHYKDRNPIAASGYSSTAGAQHAGDIKIKRSEVNKPGSYETPSRKSAARVAKKQGTGFAGQLKSSHKNAPGVLHSDRKFDAPVQNQQAGAFSGYQRTKIKNVPGTHHSDRKPDSPIQNQQAGSFSGHQKNRIKNAPGTLHTERKGNAPAQNQQAGFFAGHKKVKRSELVKPGTHFSDRTNKQARKSASYSAMRYGGNIKVPSKASQKRQHEKLAAKVHQYEGDVRMRYRKKNMHPSVADQKANRYSPEQQAKLRKLHHWWTKLWKKNSDQPKHVKQKERRPRYDRDESELWND